MYKVKEIFEYLVDDCNDFCSVHDALEMDTSMPCPCWDGSKVPVNEKGEEESIPWGNSTIKVINNAVSINKDTLLQLIRDSEELAVLEAEAFDWYYTWYWTFKDQVDVDKDLIEVFPKEVTITTYEPK